MPPVHETTDIHYNHRDSYENDEWWEYVETHEQKCNDVNREKRYADAL